MGLNLKKVQQQTPCILIWPILTNFLSLAITKLVAIWIPDLAQNVKPHLIFSGYMLGPTHWVLQNSIILSNKFTCATSVKLKQIHRAFYRLKMSHIYYPTCRYHYAPCVLLFSRLRGWLIQTFPLPIHWPGLSEKPNLQCF